MSLSRFLRPSRFFTFGLCAVLLAVVLVLGAADMSLWSSVWMWAITLVLALLTAVGVRDVIQRHHSILRNYPVLGHVRWMVELVRPEIRQYLLQSDEEAAPFFPLAAVPRLCPGQVGGLRASLRHPARRLSGRLRIHRPFHPPGSRRAIPESFRITIGGDQCAKPYSASVFNISAMSFGSLSANAILALNQGAKRGGFCA